MKALIKTATIIAALAPQVSFAQNIPVDFPSSFPIDNANATQAVTKLDTTATVTVAADTSE